MGTKTWSLVYMGFCVFRALSSFLLEKKLTSLLEKNDNFKVYINVTWVDRILILETQLDIFLIMLASNIFTVKLFSWTLANNILRKLKYYSTRKIEGKFMISSVKFHICLLDIVQEFKFQGKIQL